MASNAISKMAGGSRTLRRRFDAMPFSYRAYSDRTPFNQNSM
ncbi:hypothetical protein ABH994_003213 [Bradyrhizobium yuanmingense]